MRHMPVEGACRAGMTKAAGRQLIGKAEDTERRATAPDDRGVDAFNKRTYTIQKDMSAGTIMKENHQLKNTPEAKTDWHAIDTDRALAILATGRSGISSSDAAARLARYGRNTIARDATDGMLKLLWRQVNNPLIWVLIASCALAVLLGKMTDGLIVLAVVVINTIIGFIQEYKAGKAIEALSQLVPQNTAVMRDGRVMTLPVSEIVPGDIVQLSSGDRVPADMRLIQVKNLQIEEAALTGESVPARKMTEPVEPAAGIGDRLCMAYGGTLVISGTALGLITATGGTTELGRISAMLGETTDLETPLTKKLASVGKYLTVAILAITLVIMAIGTTRAVWQGMDVFSALKETMIFAIALAVGAIPEGLPAIVTIALAIGVQRMAKRNAIIRKLPAVETLGSTTVICTDKTGTLTRNEMTVVEVWVPGHRLRLTGTGYHPDGHLLRDGVPVDSVPQGVRRLLTDGALCNDASISFRDGSWSISGDPTEASLLVAAEKIRIDTEGEKSSQPRLDVIPFESEHQYMATLHGGDAKRIILKGAPEIIIPRCADCYDAIDGDLGVLSSLVEDLGSRGMRVLAVAEKACPAETDAISPDDVLTGFSLVGFIGMIDPPRQEAIEAVAACHQAGIVVKMITGDHRTTAQSIGVEVGLSRDGRTVTGAELARMDSAEFSAAAMTANIFARVAPEHKLNLVRALQKENHIVSMTGDGVNDAPALKQANIGVAMGITGTSVAKESADIVLADDNFASIKAAVEEGRRVYDNLVKSLAFLLPTNLGIALIFICAILFFPFDPLTKELLLPMTPAQLLWINMIAAVALALPFAFEVKEPTLMSRPPRDPDAPLFSGFVLFRTVFVSIVMTAGTLLLFQWEYQRALAAGVHSAKALPEAQTMAVTFVIFFQIFYMFNCRTLKDSLLKIGFFSNTMVFAGIAVVLVLQSLLIYAPLLQSIFGTAPLDLRGIGISALCGALIFPVIALEKWLRFR